MKPTIKSLLYTLVETRPTDYWRPVTIGEDFCPMWNDLLKTATPVDAQIPLGIELPGSYNHCQSRNALGNTSQWTSSRFQKTPTATTRPL